MSEDKVSYCSLFLKEKNEVVTTTMLPDFFVCELLNIKFYFNPFTEIGLNVKDNREEPAYSWTKNRSSFFRDIKYLSKHKLHIDPDPFFQKIKYLYVENNLDIPEVLERHILYNSCDQKVIQILRDADPEYDAWYSNNKAGLS